MTRPFVAAIAAAATLLCLSTAASAQAVLPFTLEARAGYGVPVGEWTESDELSGGFGYGLNAQVNLLPLISVYGGWDRFSFALAAEDETGAQVDGSAKDSGLRGGVRLSLPRTALFPVTAFAFGGLTYRELVTGGDEAGGLLRVESEGAFGLEVGGGLGIPLGPVASLTPAVMYRSHSVEFEIFQDLEGSSTEISYFAMDLGVRLGL